MRLAHKTSLTRPLLIKVPVPSLESERSYIFVFFSWILELFLQCGIFCCAFHYWWFDPELIWMMHSSYLVTPLYQMERTTSLQNCQSWFRFPIGTSNQIISPYHYGEWVKSVSLWIRTTIPIRVVCQHEY